MKKILSILCASAMLTVSSGMVYASENNFADELEWGQNDYAVGAEKYEGETYTKGDWVYDKTNDKIVDYTGKGGDIVIPPNSTVSKYINVRKHGFNAYTRGEINITSLTVSEGVTVEGNLISYDNPCKRIIFNNSIKQMPDTSLYIKGNTSLEYLKLPSDMTSISDSSFRECTGLKEVVIPDTVTSIENEAFLGCYNLSSVNLPQGLKSIGYRAFAGCQSLKSVDIPKGVTSIGEYAFINCKSLKSISFGDGFDYTKLLLPDSVEEINYSGKADMYEFAKYFRDTEWAKKYYGGYGDFAVKDGVLMKYNGTNKTPVIPDTVTKIGYEAFRRSDITAVTIPDSVTEIDDKAFGNCKSLKKVTIPASVKTIGEEAFGSCKTLESLTIEGAPYIKAKAFCDTALRRATMNIKKDFKYAGIETNTRYEYDPLIYYYPDFEESWLSEAGDWFVMPVVTTDGKNDIYLYGLPPTPAPEASVTALPTEKPTITPKSTPKTDKDKIAIPSEIIETAAPITAPTEPEKEARTFNDVSKDDKQLTEAIDYLYKKGVVNGYSGEQGNVFLPDSDITRAEIAKMLDVASENKSNNEKNYTDVNESHWAYNYIKRSLYFEGYEDGSFKPEGKISYGEAVTAIVRFAGLEDQAKGSGLDYPENYIKAAADYGITDGITVNKNISATRGDVAIILYNAMNRR